MTQFKVAQEQQRLETMTAQIAQTEQTLNNTQAAIEKKEKELQSLQKQAKEQRTAALTVQEIRSMGKKTITGNITLTPFECNILKDYATTGLLVKAENSRLEEKLRSAQWSAAIWKQLSLIHIFSRLRFTKLESGIWVVFCSFTLFFLYFGA